MRGGVQGGTDGPSTHRRRQGVRRMAAIQMMTRRSERWKQRLICMQEHVRTHLECLDENELEWAPDVGIASIGDHISSICSAQWDLARCLVGDFDPCRAASAQLPMKEQLVASLQGSWRRISNWLADEGLLALDEDGDPSREDALLEHITLVGVELGASQTLLQLIDPERELPAVI